MAAQQLPLALQKKLRPLPPGGGGLPGGLAAPADTPTLHALMRGARDERLRRAAFEACQRQPAANLAALDALVEVRSELLMNIIEAERAVLVGTACIDARDAPPPASGTRLPLRSSGPAAQGLHKPGFACAHRAPPPCALSPRATGATTHAHVRRAPALPTAWLQASIMRNPCRASALPTALLQARHEVAALMGFPSYAAYQLDSFSLAGQPSAVVAFLERLTADIAPKCAAELAEMQELKRAHLGAPGGAAGGSAGGGEQRARAAAVVRPWDRQFLAQAARSGEDAVQLNALPEYFELERVVEGLGELLRRSMGVSLRELPLEPGEACLQQTRDRCCMQQTRGLCSTARLQNGSRQKRFSACAGGMLRPTCCEVVSMLLEPGEEQPGDGCKKTACARLACPLWVPGRHHPCPQS